MKDEFASFVAEGGEMHDIIRIEDISCSSYRNFSNADGNAGSCFCLNGKEMHVMTGSDCLKAESCAGDLVGVDD
ncbi:MAG: hypothetical protein MZV63_34905 [Marinilabiliales bacterium]|nr:hypothetical protein [Marinilabiliales bacterium]